MNTPSGYKEIQSKTRKFQFDTSIKFLSIT